MASLVSIDGGHGGINLDSADRTLVGRAAGNTYVINDSSISHIHCSFENTDAGWVLQDMMSTNGTFVNGQRVSNQILAVGDTVQIGNLKFRFELTADAAAPAGIAAPAAPAPQPAMPLVPGPTGPSGALRAQPAVAASSASPAIQSLPRTLLQKPQSVPAAGLPKQPAVAAMPAKGTPDPQLRAKPQSQPLPKSQPQPAIRPEPEVFQAAPSAQRRLEKKTPGPPPELRGIMPARRTRTLFAWLGFMLFLIGIAPFLKVGGGTLFFFDCFKAANRPAAMLLFTPFVMGFAIFLCALLAKHLWPVLGGLLMLAIVLTTGNLLYKATTPDSMLATLEGGGGGAAVDSPPVAVTPETEGDTGSAEASGGGLLKITIPNGTDVANSLNLSLLSAEEGILARLANVKLKHLFLAQIAGVILMLGICVKPRFGNRIGQITASVTALVGALFFLVPMFVPLADETMLFGRVRSIGVAAIYVPLIMMALFCIIGNMTGPGMLTVAGIVFWAGLPLCPVYTGVAAVRSGALIPYLQYVRLLTPHYLVIVMLALAVSRLIRDASNLPSVAWYGIRLAVYRIRLAVPMLPVLFRRLRIFIKRRMIRAKIRRARKKAEAPVKPRTTAAPPPAQPAPAAAQASAPAPAPAVKSSPAAAPAAKQPPATASAVKQAPIAAVPAKQTPAPAPAAKQAPSVAPAAKPTATPAAVPAPAVKQAQAARPTPPAAFAVKQPPAPALVAKQTPSPAPPAKQTPAPAPAAKSGTASP